MPSHPPLSIPPALLPAAVAALILSTFAPAARAADPLSLTVVERSVSQDQGSWQVDYRLRHNGTSGIIVTPAEVSARIEGWVSNSRVSGHAAPRLSSMLVSGT